MVFFQFEAAIVINQKKDAFSEAAIVKPLCLQEKGHLISNTPLLQHLQFTKQSGVAPIKGNTGSKMIPH